MKLVVPTREDVLKLLNGAKKVPFSPNFVQVDSGNERLFDLGEFDPKATYVLSQTATALRVGDISALVQRIPLGVVFSDEKSLDEFKRATKFSGYDPLTQELYQLGLLDKQGFEIDRVSIVRDMFSDTPFFNALYLFPTDVCNLKCLYCNVENNMSDDYKKGFMRFETAMRAIDLFIENLKQGNQLGTHKPKYISFYGGEALLNRDLLNHAIEYSRRKINQEGLDGKVNICLMINGILLDDDEARFLQDNDVNVTISFDGLPRHHNTMRLFHDGSGSFDKTLRGYEKIRSRCNVIILCTVGNHNVNDLEEIASYFANELQPTAAEFSLVRNLKFGSSPAEIESLDVAFERLYAAHKILIEKGIPDNNFSRIILALANSQVYSYHLTRCGDILYAAPNGELYTCDSLLGMKRSTQISVRSSVDDLRKDSQVLEWYRRHPFSMEDCGVCVPISICGGGCPYNAEVSGKSIYTKDTQMCQLTHFVFNRVVRDLGAVLKDETDR